MKDKNDFDKVKNQLIKLYLSVKINKTNLEESDNYNEIENLKKLSLLTLIEYIKSSIDVIVETKLEEELKKYQKVDEKYAATQYETLLRKEEGEIREHISMGHQLKLHCEKLTDIIEELKDENEQLEKELKNQKEAQKNEEENKRELSRLHLLLSSYEEQNLKLVESVKRLKTQLVQKDKEIKSLETKIASSQTSSSFYSNFNNKNYSLLQFENSKNLSSNSSMCSHSRSKSRIVNSHKGRSIMKVEEKLSKYHKLLDKRLLVTRNKSSSKSYRDKSHNMSMISREKSIENDISAVSRKKEDLSQKLNETMKAKKKIPFVKGKIKNLRKEGPSKLIKKSSSQATPFVINQSNIPCVNNINIYTGTDNSNQSQSTTGPANQMNLRQFIFSKCSTKSTNRLTSHSKN